MRFSVSVIKVGVLKIPVKVIENGVLPLAVLFTILAIPGA
jgi:hypothetical protein